MSLSKLFLVAAHRTAQRLWATCLRWKLLRFHEDEVLHELTNGRPGEAFWKEFLADFPNRFFYSPRNRKEFFVGILQTLQPYDEIIDDAHDAAARTFDLLGSGPVTLGTPIAWSTDYKTGTRWKQAFYSFIERENEVKGGDIKVPWELGRFQYLVWLGKGYWVSNNRRYVDAFRSLIDEWIAANPFGAGIQWNNAMEAGLRACNWIAGFAFFLDEPTLTPEFWRRAFAALWMHGEFIEENLEITRRSGNHLIADYTGLAFLGAMFKHTIEGQRWFVEGVRGIEREILRQTTPDGVDYEQSIAYHRFVAEMALAVLQLCRHTRTPFRDDVAARIERMCEFTLHYSRADGSAPNIGDNDNGRLFRVRAQENFLNHTALLSTAAVVFSRGDFKAAAGRFAEETLWLAGAAGWERFHALDPAPVVESHAFPNGGFYVLRSPSIHCIVDAGELGKQGWGGHGHNDTLSFELWCGEPVIVDCGTFCYTADREARDAFRGTAAHNTAMIDNVEIAEFAGPFKIAGDPTAPVVSRWSTTNERDELEASHHAYSRLTDPVVHTRAFALDKPAGVLTIRDTFTCSGSHRIALAMHFAPAMRVDVAGDGTMVISGSIARVRFTSSHSWTIETCEVSPSYGIRVPSSRAVCIVEITGTQSVVTTITHEALA